MSLLIDLLGYGGVGIHISWITGLFVFLVYRFSSNESERIQTVRDFLVERFRELSLILVVAATSGSLYISEIIGAAPCPLCWYQRIFMYPLTILFLISLVLMKRDVKVYTIPLALIGAGISLFHYAVQVIGEFSTNCSTAVPCSEMHVEILGYVSVPLMAFTVFITVIILNYMSFREEEIEIK